MSSLVIAAGVLGVLGLLLTTALMLGHRFLAVAEDPRIRVLEEALPGNNCGACGFPGCQGFAEALTTGAAQPGQCTVSTLVMKERIARFLETSVGQIEQRVARRDELELVTLADVDQVVVFAEETPLALIEALRPDVLIKGAEYTLTEVVGAELVQGYGGRVLLAEILPGHSTSRTIGRI